MKYSYLLLLLVISNISYSQSNQAPIAINDYATTDVGVNLATPSGTPDFYPSILDNDTDVNNDNLVVTRYSLNEEDWVNAGEVLNLNKGSIRIFSDGNYNFIPNSSSVGIVSSIYYEISDGTDVAVGGLYLGIELSMSESLIEIYDISSCNQGYTKDGEYRIKYELTLWNRSETRGYHKNSEIGDLQIINNLNDIFGVNCINRIDRNNISLINSDDYYNGTEYPVDFDVDSFNEIEFDHTNVTPGSSGILDSSNGILYPKQIMTIEYCVYIDPFCNGRPNPTPAGSNIDFENVFEAVSSRGIDTKSLLITDFHTTETTVAANLYVGGSDTDTPTIRDDSTFEYYLEATITNDGNFPAQNVNFNLGLQNYIDSGGTIITSEITQISGPSVAVNSTYNGTSVGWTKLLEPNNTLNPNETIVLSIHFIVKIQPALAYVLEYQQLQTSMSQGSADGQGVFPDMIYEEDGTVLGNAKYCYVLWSDSLGSHVDTYYTSSSPTEIPNSNNQCVCQPARTKFIYVLAPTLINQIVNIDSSPQGIDELEEITFELKLTNNSVAVKIKNLQIYDDFNIACGDSFIRITEMPHIVDIVANETPILNSAYDGINDIGIFTGTTGLLHAESATEDAQYVTVQFKVLFKDDCIEENTAQCSANDLTGIDTGTAESTINLNIFSDTDNDGVTNVEDLDDDNDGILDWVELNGLNPLLDSDHDGIPYYRESTLLNDINSDGVVDVFDTDFDGIPNHLDLDSDNDGLMDLYEAGGIDTDNNGIVPVNSDNTLLIDADEDGLTDSLLVDNDGDLIPDIPVDVDVTDGLDIPYIDSDNDTLANALDIDSDNDGIVDVIEAQNTANYIVPVISMSGTVYSEGLIPIDSDNDSIPDYLDSDADNDLIVDSIEGNDFNNDGIADVISLNSDLDNDGLDDAFDLLINNGTAINSTNNQNPLDFPNANIVITEERDWRELIAPTIVIADAEVEEGDNLLFHVSLSSLSTTPIIIGFNVEDQTATLNQDYTLDSNNLSLTIPNGVLNGVFSIESIDDNIKELDVEQLLLKAIITSENTINLNLNNIGKINDNEPLPTVLISKSTVTEGEIMNFDISIDVLNYQDINLNVFSNSDTANDPEDFEAIETEVVIPALQDKISVSLQTFDDKLVENSEFLELKAIVTSFNTFNVNSENIGKILDNDFVNLFSPNNDGLSDEFKIPNLMEHLSFEIRIFNRWGSLVYHYNNNGNPNPEWWNGTMDGNPVSEGTYYYTINYNNDTAKPKTGFVQLIR